jgi:hypothetical protein
LTKNIVKKLILGRPLSISHPPTPTKSRVTAFSCENRALLGRRESNLRPPSRMVLLEPLHVTLTRVYNRFSFSSYYPQPNLNWVFETLNEFKSKGCQLQSCIIFWDLQLFLFVVSSSEAVWKIRISNVGNLNVIILN